LESLQRQHARYVAEKVEDIEATLQEIKVQRAEQDGENRALARLGARVVVFLTVVGSIFAWATSESGHGLLKKMLD